MTIKRLICGVGLFLAAQSFPAFAVESSTIYQYYLSEGIKAFERHSDDDASRYFAWAHEIDPSAAEPQKYAKALSERQRLEARAQDNPSAYSPYFDEMIQKGKDALQRKDYTAAKQYFYTAHLLDRRAAQPLEYLNLVKRASEGRVVVETPVPARKPVPKVEISAPEVVVKASSNKASLRPVDAALDRFEKPAPAKTKASRNTPASKEVKPVDVIKIDDILAHAEGGRALLKIDLGTSVIVEGRNIQKFLVVTEGAVKAAIIARDQLKIDTQAIGVTFIHIWDDNGRRTIYTQVVFPPPPPGDLTYKSVDNAHAAPFRLKYSNDWNTYYSGNDVPGMNKKSANLQQNIGIEGETPYGYFDASGTSVGWHQPVDLVTYTTGLTGIPVWGLKDFNVRFFDATRQLTQLTLPSTMLRGAFVDATFFTDVVRLSYISGREMGTFGYFSQGDNRLRSSYVDAGRILFFPKDPIKHYSFNYARGYGERDASLTKDVYSVEGEHKFGRATFKAEFAEDDKTHAATAGVRWDDGEFHTALNAWNVGKDFTTVTGTGSQQGVTGATWTTASLIRKARVTTALDVYQNHLFYDPADQDGINYTASAQADVPLNEVYSLDSSVSYTDTPNELSPRKYFSGTTRLTRVFDVWGGRKGSAYIGSSYQRSRYKYVPTAEYDRTGAITGFYVPLTSALSFNGNYEYSWLVDTYSDEDYNPNVLTTGLAYYKQLTDKIHGNMGVNYRLESGFGGTNSYLAGEDSLGYSAGVTYTPVQDVTLFFDGRLNNVWGKVTGNTSYNDMDLRLGMRSTWGTGFYWDPQGTVEGVVFKDKNGNGKFEKGEEGIAGVKVKVGEKEVTTNAAGWYNAAVKGKQVTVTAVTNTIPQGFIFSTPAFAKVMIRQGLRDRINFGLTTRSGIYGVVFVDKNGSGVPDQDDEFVGRVKVMIDGKIAQITDAQGAYFFTNVSPGKHTLSLDIKSLPLKYLPMIKLQNEVNVTEGTTYLFHIPVKFKSK